MLASGCVYSSSGSLCCASYTDLLSLDHSIANGLFLEHVCCEYKFLALRASFRAILLQLHL